MITPKDYISGIIKEGIESAQKIKDDALKEKVIIMFKKLSDSVEDSSKLSHILDLARTLSISVMEAIEFIDYEELELVVLSAKEEIKKL